MGANDCLVAPLCYLSTPTVHRRTKKEPDQKPTAFMNSKNIFFTSFLEVGAVGLCLDREDCSGQHYATSDQGDHYGIKYKFL